MKAAVFQSDGMQKRQSCIEFGILLEASAILWTKSKLCSRLDFRVTSLAAQFGSERVSRGGYSHYNHLPANMYIKQLKKQFSSG